jgi:hypothetical protein
MTLDLKNAKAIVKDYTDKVRSIMPVSKVILYGIYATDQAEENIRADVYFFLPRIKDENLLEIDEQLIHLAETYSINIELNIFHDQGHLEMLM